MDSDAFKDLKTSRGYTYHYYISALWAKKGYGIIAPDLLGYAGTDKPTDPAEYRMKLMMADIVEVLDAEKAKKVVSIAHDWGCDLNSRLANDYAERFEAFAFFAIPYFPPVASGTFDIDAVNAASKEKHGYTRFGYWKFFETERATKVIEVHYDSFISVFFAKDHLVMRDNFCVEGALEEWLVSDRTTETISYISDETRATGKAILLKGGFSASLCWYKAFVQNHTPKDDAEIQKDKYLINKLVFFGAALKDPTSPAEQSKAATKTFVRKLTLAESDTDHWILFAARDKVNAELEKWTQSLNL
ncbi:alpha/beta-hydrolase [Phellopilus nigrolimitatus]|nr:alpha/beta-hydrolase [Phellopilus nigrolimitatus]